MKNPTSFRLFETVTHTVFFHRVKALSYIPYKLSSWFLRDQGRSTKHRFRHKHTANLEFERATGSSCSSIFASSMYTFKPARGYSTWWNLTTALVREFHISHVIVVRFIQQFTALLLFRLFCTCSTVSWLTDSDLMSKRWTVLLKRRKLWLLGEIWFGRVGWFYHLWLSLTHSFVNYCI